MILFSHWIHRLFVFGNVDALSLSTRQLSKCSWLRQSSYVYAMWIFRFDAPTSADCNFMYRSWRKENERQREKKLGKATENNVSGLTGSSTHSLLVFSAQVLVVVVVVVSMLLSMPSLFLSIPFSSRSQNFNFSYLFLTTYSAYSYSYSHSC